MLARLTRLAVMMTALTVSTALLRRTCRVSTRTYRRGKVLAMGLRRHAAEEPPFPSIDAMTRQLKLQSVLQKGTLPASTNNVIDQTVVFPSIFLIKVIGANDQTFAQDMVNSVAAVINVLPENIPIETKVTSGGKYQSVTLSPTFQTADEIYKSYAAMSLDKRVKFVM